MRLDPWAADVRRGIAARQPFLDAANLQRRCRSAAKSLNVYFRLLRVGEHVHLRHLGGSLAGDCRERLDAEQDTASNVAERLRRHQADAKPRVATGADAD